MKNGDKVEVLIAGQVVAHAEIKEVGDGDVTLIVPATRVVMATRTELTTPEPVAPDTTGTETIITGVDRVVDGQRVESATVSDTTPTQTQQENQTEQAVPTVETQEVPGPTEGTTQTSSDVGPSTNEPTGAATDGGGTE